MTLRGRRLVWAAETDEGRRFSPAKVKILTGGDRLIGRNPHDKREVSFAPSHNLILVTNDQPRANFRDRALWARLLLIEFLYSYVDSPKAPHERQRNANIKEELLREGPGIASWLVAGYYSWKEMGLAPPPCVLQSTSDYQASQDTIGLFIEECCVVGADFAVRAKPLFEGYSIFCKENHFRPLGSRKFGEGLKLRFERGEDNKSRYYKGIRLKDDLDGGALLR
jgi:putative DNA primase/helicase